MLQRQAELICKKLGVLHKPYGPISYGHVSTANGLLSANAWLQSPVGRCAMMDTLMEAGIDVTFERRGLGVNTFDGEECLKFTSLPDAFLAAFNLEAPDA